MTDHGYNTKKTVLIVFLISLKVNIRDEHSIIRARVNPKDIFIWFNRRYQVNY